MRNPKPADFVKIDPLSSPTLIVVIDTEEEFDWSKDFSRDQTSVRAMRSIHRVQDVFDEYGITPIYMVDYPVASQPDGYRPLQEIHASGHCLIGSHLHPWVNPPFEESVTRRFSFPGNLPRSLEAEKLRVLTETITERFGVPPTVYKAGRYGVGPHTADILEDQGYKVDLSVCPGMDYAGEGGPDFSNFSAWPYWFGSGRRMLEIPLTAGFSGRLRRWGRILHERASRPAFASLRAPGVLARLGLLDKTWLSPEGFKNSEHQALVRDSYRDGLRVFSYAFHSPSVEPGHTPYVRSQADLEKFLSRCRRFFEFFMGEFGGKPSTPLELKAALTSTTRLSDSEDSSVC